MSGQPTPGPWRWEVHLSGRRVQLCGGPPKRGFGKYDLTVMGFARWGLNAAAPVFWDWDYDKLVGEPHRADTIAVPVPGREHHERWFRDIDHPDARLIAAAPDQNAALRLFVEQWEACGPNSDFGRYFANVYQAAKAALAKAEDTP